MIKDLSDHQVRSHSPLAELEIITYMSGVLDAEYSEEKKDPRNKTDEYADKQHTTVKRAEPFSPKFLAWLGEMFPRNIG